MIVSPGGRPEIDEKEYRKRDHREELNALAPDISESDATRYLLHGTRIGTP